MGADAFTERARRELLTTGERFRTREVEPRTELTPQEEHIARLARDGHTNPEIAAKLFLSARTVEWHLRKIFTKLGIASRKDLDHALAGHRRGVQGRSGGRPDHAQLWSRRTRGTATTRASCSGCGRATHRRVPFAT